MSDQNYRLAAVKRDWIPEWLYALVVRSFLKPLCSRQPLRWILHEELPSPLPSLVTVTDDYAVQDTDHTILVDASGKTVTLPDPSTVPADTEFRVKNTAAGGMTTVAAAAAPRLDGVESTDDQYYHGYEGDCSVCGEPANRRWTWSDGYAEDRCSRHWVSESLREWGEHPGIARIEILDGS